VPGTTVHAFRDLEVRSVQCSSAEVRPGDLFVALRGARHDGHDYVADALRRGAVAVAAERAVSVPDQGPVLLAPAGRVWGARAAAAAHGHPAQSLTVAGITGTNGKTTTAFLLRSILEEAGIGTALLGTVHYQIGDRILPSPNTTPGPVELQRLLAEARDAGSRAAVLEVSSHALVQRRVEGLPFRVGVFTNLSHEHLDYHRTLDEYERAKALLFEGLAPDAAAILNADDPVSERYRRLTRARVLTFGLGEGSDVCARIEEATLDGSAFRMTTPRGHRAVRTSLIGPWNVRNCLAAGAAALALDVPLDAVIGGLESVRGVPGRAEPVQEGQPFPVLVDYAHTPAALESLLRGLRPLVAGRLHLVFGCGGDRDREKRPVMGRVACAWADRVVVTSDNPRSEDPVAILEEIRKGMTASHRPVVEPDRMTAIVQAVSEAREGDLVLIAGKGHENRQFLRDTVIPFDDREAARQALRMKFAPGPTVRAGAA
jgi:UDP-N-acetylmuramoyl-L-alanyl-D-glutamate--2,6-diaminopimelate ligase